jgi:general secretion pathway protein D
LIEDRFEVTRSKIPLLGDLPLVGALFRSESRTRKRSNLMVFLRPVVVRDTDSANRLSVDRYEQIRGEQKAAQPESSYVLPSSPSPLLPAVPERGKAWSRPNVAPPAEAPPPASDPPAEPKT